MDKKWGGVVIWVIEWENHRWREAKQILGVTVQDGYNINLDGVISNKIRCTKIEGGGGHRWGKEG